MSRRGLSILVVEDEMLVALALRQMLEASGHQVTDVVSSAEEALSAAADRRPDVALLDIRLKGGLDGVELARRLHRDHGVRSMFLSGSRDSDTLARASAVKGSLGFLAKPFLATDLLEALEGVAV